jgi:hypothetical protein
MMKRMKFVDWLWSVMGSVGITAALVAAAAWLGRSQITQWLTRDLERLKHQHQRELEAYKVSMLADIERTKARQEVQKSGALKIIEKKYEALHELHMAVAGIAGHVIAAAQMVHPSRTDGAIERVERLARASEVASMFLAPNQGQTIAKFRTVLANVLERITKTGDLNDPLAQAAENRSLNMGEFEVQIIVSALLDRMMAME